MSKRLFVALDLPDSISGELEALNPNLPRLRWLPASQQHLTLAFLDDVALEAEERLKEKLAEANVPPFFLPVQGLGSFSRKGRPSVVWAGIGKGHPHLFLLHRRINDTILAAGLEPDLRPFHPHITIARGKGISREMLRPFLRQHAQSDFGSFRATGFSLYSSKLFSTGAKYTCEFHREFTR